MDIKPLAKALVMYTKAYEARTKQPAEAADKLQVFLKQLQDLVKEVKNG